MLSNIKEVATKSERDRLTKLSEKFHEHSDQVQDVRTLTFDLSFIYMLQRKTCRKDSVDEFVML